MSTFGKYYLNKLGDLHGDVELKIMKLLMDNGGSATINVRQHMANLGISTNKNGYRCLTIDGVECVKIPCETLIDYLILLEGEE